MQRLAADIALRANFGICAIEVVRPEGWLEFVAIAGDDERFQELLGTGSTLEHTLWAIQDGVTHGDFTFVRSDDMRQETRAAMEMEAVIPDIPESSDPDDWNPWDMFFAQVFDDSGRLRALVYLDLPNNHRRPDERQALELSEQLAVPLRSVLVVAEREEFAHYVRVIGAARRLVRSTSARHDVDHLLGQAHTVLRSALYAEELEIQLFAQSSQVDVLGLGLSPDLREKLVEAAERAWAKQHVILIEGDRVWGDDLLHESAGEWLSKAVARRGLGTVVIAPIGVDDVALGMLAAARTPSARRWSDGEGDAAIELGHDLGRAIANANATQRERQLLDELRRLEDERRRLLEVVVHELKNPMTVITANAELALDAPFVDDTLATRIGAISHGADKLRALVEDLNLLAQSTVQSASGTSSLVDVATVVAASVQSMLAVAERGSVVLQAHIQDSPVWVRGSRRAIAGAIDNLLHNAVKYSDAGGTVDVRVCLTTSSQAEVTVADVGLGISAEDQELLFTPMFRSTNPEALERPGTGLGLTIVREVAERHGGSVEVSSELGVGTTVRLLLGVPVEDS